MTLLKGWGPSFPDAGWVPSPRYLLRRARVGALLGGVSPGRLLEVGPGAGALLTELAGLGFSCEALEPSAPARAVAGPVLSGVATLHAAPPDGWAAAFDVLLALDVLEHIEDDVGALAAWHAWLKPGGTMVLSVPARMRLWTAGDTWAGHFRRYERDGLRALLDRVGFEVEAFECYGFPLANVTEQVGGVFYRRTLHGRRADNNDRSGVDRRGHLRAFRWMQRGPARWTMAAFLALQTAFLGRDWGSGYVLRARRRP